MMIECPMCMSRSFIVLGTLGNLTWVRCVDCGTEYTIDMDIDPGDLEVDDPEEGEE